MAKPGSAAARAISGAVDLAAAAVPLDVQRIEQERKAGMRCGGCKRRVRVGFEFVTFVVVEQPGARDRLATARTYACTRDDCGYASQCAMAANAMRTVEWVYLDGQRGEAVAGAADPALEFGSRPDIPDSRDAGTLPTP